MKYELEMKSVEGEKCGTSKKEFLIPFDRRLYAFPD